MGNLGGLYWEAHGAEDAPPLLLSSGLGGLGNYWRPNLAALAGKFRVILYDHRGTGRSDRAIEGRLTVEAMAQDVLMLLDGLGIARAHLVGHAAGGAIGLSLAVTAPERIGGLVVVNGWARLDPHFARCFDARLTLLLKGGPRDYLAAQPIFLYPAGWSSQHNDELDAELEHQLAGFPDIDTVVKRITALRTFRIDDQLKRIRAPVLLIAADDDMLVPVTCSELLRNGIPGAQLTRFAYGGHACNVTQAEAFNRLVLPWLRARGPLEVA